MKRISQLTQTATESDLVAGNYLALDGSAGTKKLPGNCIAPNSVQNALLESIAPPFRTTDDYAKGDVVQYLGRAYRFTTNHSAGAWNQSDVTSIRLSAFLTIAIRKLYEEAITTLSASDVFVSCDSPLWGQPRKVAITNFARSDYFDNLIRSVCPVFSTNTTYEKYGLVIYQGALYQFTASHTGAWTGSDVQLVNVCELFKRISEPALESIFPSEIINLKSGVNKLNVNLPHETDVYYSYTTGNRISSSGSTGYYAYKVKLKPNFTYTWFGAACHIAHFDKYRNFISGSVATNANAINFTTPVDCAYTMFSFAHGYDNLNVVQINEGSTELPLVPYSDLIDGHKSWFFPYVYNNELVTNKLKPNRTATYLCIEREAAIKEIECKWKYDNNGKTFGTVALGIYKTKRYKVDDITDHSLHLTYNGIKIKLDILGGAWGEYYYHTIINQEVALDTSIAEHSLKLTWSGENCTVTLDGVDYTGTNTSDKSLSADVCGNYGFLEHYCTGDMNNCDMPRFTYYASQSGSSSMRSRDYFIRENGIPTKSPQGFPYYVMSNDDRGHF